MYSGAAIRFNRLPLTASVGLVIGLLILLSGNVESNPGPGTSPKGSVTPADPIHTHASSTEIRHSMDTETGTQFSFTAPSIAGQSAAGPVISSMDFQNLMSSINSISEDIKEMKSDIQEVKSQFNERITAVEEKTENMSCAIDDLQEQVITMKMKLTEKNLVIWDIPERNDETPTERENAVRDYIDKDLGVHETVDIVESWRQGQSGKRSVVVTFSSVNDKRTVLEAAKSSKDHERRVRSDLPYEVRQARKDLAPFYARAKNEKRKPTVRGCTLFVDGVAWKYDKVSKTIVNVGASKK